MKWQSKPKPEEDKLMTSMEPVDGSLDRSELSIVGEPFPCHQNTTTPKLTIIDVEEQNKHKGTFYRPSFIPVLTTLAILLIVFLPRLENPLGRDSEVWESINKLKSSFADCSKTCKVTLVESIPEGLEYPNRTIQPSIFQSWKDLVARAESSIDIASFYWSLTDEDVGPHPSDWQGEEIFENLKLAALKRGIQIRVAQNKPSKSAPDHDTAKLQALGAAQVRNLDFDRLVGAGILHTKLWVVDQRHFFLGSANMDWRSLTQVKELGAAVYDCPCLAEDVSKIFEVYWSLGDDNATIPKEWPPMYATDFNHLNPMAISLNGTNSLTYVASSPPQLCPPGRSKDLDAILDTMNRAREYIDIAVMDYIPAMLYTKNHQFWPEIDDQLRRVAIDNGIKIRLLVSHWNHSHPAMMSFLKSLSDLSQVYPSVEIEVKIFIVPVFSPDQGKIPFARVNHNKYMVTDQAAYIGTSNWSGDYFINTGGVGLVINGTSLRDQLQNVFDRDWESEYSHPLKSMLPSM